MSDRLSIPALREYAEHRGAIVTPELLSVRHASWDDVLVLVEAVEAARDVLRADEYGAGELEAAIGELGARLDRFDFGERS